MAPENCGTCSQGRAELLGMIASLSIQVVALQNKLDPAHYCSNPMPSGSLTLHSENRTNKFGHLYRKRYNLIDFDDDGGELFVDICPGCGGVEICMCSDEEQLASLLSCCAAYSQGKCTHTTNTHTSNGGVVSHICASCLKTQGKKFHHAAFECNNKEVKCKKRRGIKKQTSSRDKCTITQQTITSNRVYCEFCFNKTGKQFSHAEIHCHRKNKFSKNM
jgi:hypothetical protein